MKQPKKPTYAQKLAITKKGLNANEYLVRSEVNDVLVIVHKETGEEKELKLLSF